MSITLFAIIGCRGGIIGAAGVVVGGSAGGEVGGVGMVYENPRWCWGYWEFKAKMIL
jgi:hypothetical protein